MQPSSVGGRSVNSHPRNTKADKLHSSLATVAKGERLMPVIYLYQDVLHLSEDISINVGHDLKD